MAEDKLPQISGLLRASVLRMAETWQSLGQVNQAVGGYLRILERYPDSPEAAEARHRLLSLAAAFEQSGRFHLAMDLYERMERASR